MSTSELQPKDWTLMVIASGGNLTPVQLQKSLFLISRNVAKANLPEGFYAFSAYDYGPFCAEIYSDADALESGGLVTIDRSPGRGYRTYSVTPNGVAEAKQLRADMKPEPWDYLQEAVTWTKQQSFQSLVKAIYKHYPEMQENSVFKD